MSIRRTTERLPFIPFVLGRILKYAHSCDRCVAVLRWRGRGISLFIDEIVGLSLADQPQCLVGADTNDRFGEPCALSEFFILGTGDLSGGVEYCQAVLGLRFF